MRSVLIVDDDRLVRESLAEVTTELGCEPRLAACGIDALAAIRRSCSELVVSDVDMPDFSGFELIDRIHALHLHPPFILMSARTNETLAASARAAGAAGFLAKPVELAAYASTVKGVLHL